MTCDVTCNEDDVLEELFRLERPTTKAEAIKMARAEIAIAEAQLNADDEDAALDALEAAGIWICVAKELR